MSGFDFQAEHLRGVFGSLRTDDAFADFEIKCKDGKTFKVHRSVICPQSTFFDTACKSGFKEASEQSITLHEDDPDVVKLMIDYFYTGEYRAVEEKDVLERREEGLAAGVIMDGKMFGIACKYGIQGLKKISSFYYSDFHRYLLEYGSKSSLSITARAEALRQAYAVAELPQEDLFLRALFRDADRERERIPKADDKEFQKLLEEHHGLAVSFASLLQETFVPSVTASNNRDGYALQLFHFLEKGKWDCVHCGTPVGFPCIILLHDDNGVLVKHCSNMSCGRTPFSMRLYGRPTSEVGSDRDGGGSDFGGNGSTGSGSDFGGGSDVDSEGENPHPWANLF